MAGPMKMRATLAGGKQFSASREIKVTIGGCGG